MRVCTRRKVLYLRCAELLLLLSPLSLATESLGLSTRSRTPLPRALTYDTNNAHGYMCVLRQPRHTTSVVCVCVFVPI